MSQSIHRVEPQSFICDMANEQQFPYILIAVYHLVHSIYTRPRNNCISHNFWRFNIFIVLFSCCHSILGDLNRSSWLKTEKTLVTGEHSIYLDWVNNSVTFAWCINMQEFIGNWAVCSRMSPACRPCNAGIAWGVYTEVWADKRRNCSQVFSPVQQLSSFDSLILLPLQLLV